MDSVIQFEGTIYEDGYGLIAQRVMRDRSLHRNSKIIYAYMCSFAGVNKNAERTAFPSVSLQCAELGMSEDTYYKWRKPLLEKGYIKITKQRGENSKWDNNLYSITAVPVEQSKEKSGHNNNSEPHPKKSGTDKPYPNFPSTEKPSTEKSGTNINSFNINSFNKEEEINNTLVYEKKHAYYILTQYLQEKGIKIRTVQQIIKLLKERNIEIFNMEDVDGQLTHMMDKLTYGEVDNHNNFPAYFITGLEMRIEQSSASEQYQQEKLKEYENALQKKQNHESSILNYNWLEQ